MNYSQAYTCAAASLTGHASNVTGASWTIATAGAADGLAHHVTVRNDSATDHSAKTIALVGTDANGLALTETIAAPGTSATVTSTKAFKTLTTATPSATIGADTMDIGWAATAHSPWVDLTFGGAGFNATVAVSVGGTINFDIQDTLDPTPDEGSIAYNNASGTGKTASTLVGYTTPVRAVRVDVNSHTSGTFTIQVLQGALA